ncbi:hypothetical protein B5C34_14840 [Pacificimonas flava]|uniref:EthD domain-containing protein n=2 Tax=Pacificimonas TaxID=1960290 RepID=A0A219B0P5_9SPHN|nr:MULTISPECIES: EthD domain-containing protein [Pacificimonas]MBZ6379761.1 EthD domain-containing protein [Pacificimonas aurantium]OWV31784.1 hypothetical protein B5C34_14840 [Pacificimonas flava]
MLKLSYCLHRLPSMTREEFQDYWRGTHAPLVAAAAPHLGIHRYVQSHTVDHPLAAATAASRGIPSGDGEDYDGIAELWIEEAAPGRDPTPEAQRHAALLAEDEANFIDFTRSRMIMAREHVVAEGEESREK